MLTFKTIHDFTDNSDSFSTLSFRTIDGTNNNLINPTFNTTGSDMIRIAAPKFAPGTKNTPIDGPNPREISNVVSSGLQAGTADTTGLSAMMYVCGQFIDHDLDHTLPDGTTYRHHHSTRRSQFLSRQHYFFASLHHGSSQRKYGEQHHRLASTRRRSMAPIPRRPPVCACPTGTWRRVPAAIRPSSMTALAARSNKHDGDNDETDWTEPPRR